MAAKTSPVTASVIAWAIGEDGRPLPELADAVKVDAETLRSWAAGEGLPTVGQVTDLAKALQRPRALFFMRQPPVQTGLPTSFRHAPGDERRQVDAETRRRVRQARRLQHGISWALRDNEHVDVPRARLDASPEAAAATVRTWLGVHADAHRTWGDPHAAFDAWRAAFEGGGVLVFTPQLGADNVRGFSAWDDKAPLVAANVSGYPYEARVFTLAHELGHLVTRIDSACVDLGPSTSVPVERWCEQFGAALLMPLDVMRELQAERRIGRQDASIDDVRAVAARCKVSHRAAALRLIDLNLARRDLYTVVLSVFRPRPRPTTPRPDFRQPRRSTARIREYGAHTLELVLSELPPRDAMSLLRVNVEDVREIADKVPGVAGF